RHQRNRDTGRHDRRIAGAVQRDRLEGLDHADDGAEQTEQRRDDRDHLDEQDAALQRRLLAQDRLAELELERLRVRGLVLLVDHQHAAERVVLARGLAFQLGLHLASGDAEHDQPLEREQHAEDAERDDDVADRTALVDALAQVRRLDQEAEQLAAGHVDAEPHQRITGLRLEQRGRAVDEARLRGLALQLRHAVRLGVVSEVPAVRDEVERADTDDVLEDFLAVGRDDPEVVQPLHLAELGRLALELEPELLDLGDRRQRRRRAHLRRELAQEVDALRELDVRQRRLELAARVTGNLLNDAEQLAQAAEALLELLANVGDEQLVLLEARL